MEVTFVGATKGSGTSKAGKSFDMCFLEYALPSESFENDKVSFSKIGYEIKQISIKESLFNIIKSKFGDTINLELSPSPYDITKNYVTGIS